MHFKNINDTIQNDQVSIFTLKPTSPLEMFTDEKYEDELQDTEFKRQP